ncbi:bifunctional DedA family/phosphatase PAP2 family protein [Saccharopolyspora sp. NPDC003752]
MIDELARHILGVPGWALLLIVFVLPMLESSAFVGFLFPGEIAVLLGGVMASQQRVGLVAVVLAAACGAIVGDTIGYAVGARYGRRLLHGTLGRFVRHAHLDRGERYLAERGGKAVVFGRFTMALRIVIPGLAGMARMPYRTFALYNISGGVLWAIETALLGYFAGASWRYAAHLAGTVGLLLLALLVFGLVVSLVLRAGLRRYGDLPGVALRLATTRWARWLYRHFPVPMRWLARRMDPRVPSGLALTTAALGAAVGAWIFGGLAQDVLEREEAARLDPLVAAFVVSHRADWINMGMQVVTWLGSSVILVPLLLVATEVLLVGHRDLRATVQIWAAFLGAMGLSTMFKAIVDRPRPPLAEAITHVTGAAFPSGHATQAIATWGMLAFVLARGRSPRARTLAVAAVMVVVLFVGLSRVYLGAHWLTDVVAGYALGGTWLAVLLAVGLSPTPEPESPKQQPPARATDQDAHENNVQDAKDTDSHPGQDGEFRDVGPEIAGRTAQIAMSESAIQPAV